MEVLQTILYFSLFHYPLTLEEIFSFSKSTDIEKTKGALQLLVKQGVIHYQDSFYFYENNVSLIERRIHGNDNAKAIFKKATSVSNFISKFPYVEGVGISGSLSKGYYDTKNGDIDFFIITKKNRLWISRTLLILYKKIFLLNSKKYFCVNYFISENALEIEEKNRFTATELVTLIPMFGNGSFKRFYKENRWAYDMIPNKKDNPIENLKPIQKPRLSKTIEKLLEGSIGGELEHFFHKITYRKWKKKFQSIDKETFDIAMKSTKEVSKHHPQNFQKTIIDKLNDKYEEVNTKFNLNIPSEHA